MERRQRWARATKHQIRRSRIREKRNVEFKSDDPLYYQAVAIVLKTQNPSILLLQRHLMIKYPRAARLMEQMEKAGFVSPMQSNGTRRIMSSEIVVEPSPVSAPTLSDDGPAPKKRPWWAKILG